MFSVPVKQEFVVGLLGVSDSWSLMRLQSRCCLGLYHTGGLTGLKDPLLGRLSHVAVKQVPVPQWPLARCLSSSSCRPLHSLLECPHNMVAGFPQIEWFKRWGDMETTVSLMTWPWRSHIVFSTKSSWLHRWVLFSVGVDYTRTWKPGGRDLYGPSWKLATTYHSEVTSGCY